MAYDDAREGKRRGNWRMEWVASTFHTTPEHDVSSVTTADAHNSAANSGLNWRPRRFKWTRSFRWKTKSGFYVCAITFQLACTVRQTEDNNIIRRMRIVCWISKTTNTHSEFCNNYSLSTPKMVTRTRLIFTLYVLCMPGFFILIWNEYRLQELRLTSNTGCAQRVRRKHRSRCRDKCLRWDFWG